MSTTIPRHLRAWDYGAELRREQNEDARGWVPTVECPECGEPLYLSYCRPCNTYFDPGPFDPEFDPERDPDVYSPPLCPCGSGLEVEDDGGCICCWFARTGAAA